ncbi:MarR family winged helix-turn-helix transcriptional regulator [Streptomyces sp. NPDC055722]
MDPPLIGDSHRRAPRHADTTGSLPRDRMDGMKRSSLPDPAEQGPPLRVEEQLCFALHVAARAYDQLYRSALKDSGLTYPQYLVLLMLHQHGSLSMKELCQRLRLDSGTLSPLLRRMESAGLVQRQRNVHDERSVIIDLTHTGATVQSTVGDVPHHIATATGLPQDQAVSLLDNIRSLIDLLESRASGGNIG